MVSQRVRGFSTTMRYINRHYLSIYLLSKPTDGGEINVWY